jgi:hypothetical protein
VFQRLCEVPLALISFFECFRIANGGLNENNIGRYAQQGYQPWRGFGGAAAGSYSDDDHGLIAAIV